MSRIIIASPWQPRGELARFVRYYPRLQSIFDGGLVVALPPTDSQAEVETLNGLGVRHAFYDGYNGRHLVVRMALETDAEHVLYCDMDRLIRWLELRPDELREVAQRVQTTDSLIIGRTSHAYATHSRTLIETERIPNMMFSHYFGRAMDFSAGARGLSRRAAEFIMRHGADDENALWMDAGWAVLVKRVGYAWDYVEVEGLDWETADRDLAQAATREQQQALAAIQDGDAALWLMRSRVAQQITYYGLRALDWPLDNA